MLAVWGAHERVNGLLPPLHAPFDGVAGDFSRIPAALATGAMSKWAYEKTMSSTWEEVMNENCRILFAAIISTIATAAPFLLLHKNATEITTRGLAQTNITQATNANPPIPISLSTRLTSNSLKELQMPLTTGHQLNQGGH